MFRLLIVDDEAIVLEAMTKMIDDHYEEVMIETARNVKEGLIKMEAFRPHVVMTDIKMPGMSGIDLMAHIRQVDQKVKLIIVSAFDHFEFAKEAVKYNIEDYLLKPLTKNKLIDILDRTFLKISKEEAIRHQELDNIERFYQSVAIVESNFFNSVLLGRNYMKHIDHYRKLLDIPLERGQVVCIEFSSLQFSANEEAMNHYHQTINECGEYLKTHIKYQQKALVSHPFLNRIFVYVESLKSENIIDYYKNLRQMIIERYGLNVRVGLGEVKNIDKLSESYASSLLILRQNNDGVAMISEQEIVEGVESFEKASEELIEDFYTKRKRFKQTLRNYEYEYIKLLKTPQYIAFAEAAITEDFVTMMNLCHETNLFPEQNWYRRYMVEFLDKPSVSKMQHFETVMKELFEVYSRATKSEYNPITLDALHYIQKHFKNEVTLELLAEEINVTPQYLSKLIKDDTGMTFKAYLNEQRIEEAKRLLKRGEMSIKEIGFEMGYNDTNYFIRTFKKYEGITPKDYQRMVES